MSLIQADSVTTSGLFLAGAPPDLLIADLRDNIGAAAIRGWDGWSDPELLLSVAGNGVTYLISSNSPWAQTTQLQPGLWTLAFEDNPIPGSDFDFDDAVVTVEAIDCPISVPPVAPPPEIVVPAEGASKVHVNFLRATFDQADLYLAGDPPELLVDKYSTRGASARNFFAPGEVLVFFLRTGGRDYYSNDPKVAYIEHITDHNYRINYDLNGDGIFGDAIVHVVLTPP